MDDFDAGQSVEVLLFSLKPVGGLAGDAPEGRLLLRFFDEPLGSV